MVILELYQNDYSKDLVAFDSIEDGKAFVAQIQKRDRSLAFLVSLRPNVCRD
ncbi:Uncharacterised protein [Streptococcus pneumoniae]|nr:Uncharacterised protein [Streptococcus pneumoniae]